MRRQIYRGAHRTCRSRADEKLPATNENQNARVRNSPAQCSEASRFLFLLSSFLFLFCFSLHRWCMAKWTLTRDKSTRRDICRERFLPTNSYRTRTDRSSFSRTRETFLLLSRSRSFRADASPGRESDGRSERYIPSGGKTATSCRTSDRWSATRANLNGHWGTHVGVQHTHRRNRNSRPVAESLIHPDDNDGPVRAASVSL